MRERRPEVCNFGIAFTGDFDDEDPLVAIGVITLGDFSEHFESALDFWDQDDYRKSWDEGLRRLIIGGPVSCLATSVSDPPITNFVVVWPLYLSGDDVYVQNKLLFLDQLPHDFDPSAPWESIGPRRTVTEDCDQISEWQVTLNEIREFLGGVT
jgi:CdiI N-terminal domain